MTHNIQPTKQSRRTFVQQTSLAALAGVSTSWLHAVTAFAQDDSSPTNNKKWPAGKFFDIHTHIGRVWNTYNRLSVTELLRWMDAHDVAQAAVLPVISPEASSYPTTSLYVLEQTAKHRDRLIPFCSIDPRTAYSGGVKGLIRMFQQYVEAGAKGCGEHKPGVAINDRRNIAIFTACGEVGLPVLFHLDNIRNFDKPGLPGLEEVLQKCPKTTFIGHAQGWWASISGDVTQSQMNGYPRGPVAPGGAMDRLMEKYPNIYGDLSAGSGNNAIARDLKFGREFLIRRSDRVLFGTDFLRPGQSVPQFETYKKLELPEDVQEKIFRNNARRLLKL